MQRFRLLFSAFACTLVGSASQAAPVDYLLQIKPMLSSHCYACHGALQQKAGLRVDTAASLVKGGDNGPVLVPGKSSESRLLDHVRGRDGARRMPPPSDGEPLKDAEINLLTDWIDQGARVPASEKPEPDPRDHWAFRAPTRPAIPAVRNDKSTGGNPIDAFLAAGWQQLGLKPQPPAIKSILLRRVYLDLIGLPPTYDELVAFDIDQSPDCYEKVVDRLLASRAYGERWGRHWMDIWRYSDWWGLGAEVRNSQKHMWHWRDWIVESLNADVGYDQMVREMLAADELYPADLDKLRATGFLARSYFIFNRNTWLDETVEHTMKAFAGLTINCARCHDHKYDPLAQLDYYRMRAFFEPYQVRLDQAPGEVDFAKNGIPRVFDCNLDAPTFRFVRGDDKQPDKSRPLSPALPPLLDFGGEGLKIKPVSLPASAHTPGLRPFVEEDHLREAEQKRTAARTALIQGHGRSQDSADSRGELAVMEKAFIAADARVLALKARIAADRGRIEKTPAEATELARTAARLEKEAAVLQAVAGLASAERSLAGATDKNRAQLDMQVATARAAIVGARKELQSPGVAYTPLRGSLKSPESNLETQASKDKPFPTESTGRRTALARWLTDPRHPLAARVAVNHVWARHFGKPLVATVFDFGRKGAKPTHPELLDYLAVELQESGWSLKRLHRLIVTSNAYRMTSSSLGASETNLAVDAENRLLWRMNPVRMEAQALRDSLLHLAGELDMRIGGPSVDPGRNDDSRRRSLYFVHSHNDQHPFLSMFDDANVLECYRRAESIVPQQALALANSKFALTMAAKIAERLNRQLGEVADREYIQGAFRMLLANPPTAEELSLCERALQEWNRVLLPRPDARALARKNLVEALLNHNDFVTIR